VLTITGQYDDDQLGALRHHDLHIAGVPSEVAGRHHVVIGPWDHAATRTGDRSFGGLTFAESSSIDIRALHADWYNWVLGRGSKPDFLTDRVMYFHSGEDRWRAAADIPAGPQVLRLYPLAQQSDGHHRVLSAAPPVTAEAVELKADPRNIAADSRDEPDESAYFGDPAALRQSSNPSLVFVTPPLPEPVDLSGRFHARLTLAADVRDFDILVGAYRLTDDGSTILLGERVLRARYRSSLRHAEPWPVDTPVSVEITHFPFISLRTSPGDRLAMMIRSPHRYYEPNFQTGGVIADETMGDAVPGVIRLVQDPDQPSYLAFPLAEPPPRVPPSGH
jgi:putative CocE/NonD family hydrolase